MIPEGDEASSQRLPPEGERDTLAERRARRAWLGDAALLRRAEAAEASVRALEAHLADLRGRQAESERERERAVAQLAERELELRRVKQREYAEQQLRVEAEEGAVRARRGQRAERAELDRWQRRVEAAHAAAQQAEEQRDALAARLAAVNESCGRLREGIAALQGVAVELRTAFEREGRASRARIRELEVALERAAGNQPAQQRSEAEEAQRREEMAGALAAAVARLRTRVALAPETQGEERLSTEAPASAVVGEQLPTEAPASAVVREQFPTEAPASTVAPEQLPTLAPAAMMRERPAAAASTPEPLSTAPTTSPTADTPRAHPGPPEVSTVIVVPRLFHGRGRSARRLAPAVRRVAVRLARWADRAQERTR